MIKITDKYYITADTNCYKLIEKSTIKDEGWTYHSFSGSW